MKNCIWVLVVISFVLLTSSAPLRAPDSENITSRTILIGGQHTGLPKPIRQGGDNNGMSTDVSRVRGDFFDPSKLKPWYGNYAGPGNNGYTQSPVDSVDAAAHEHDLAYDGVCLSQPSWGLVDFSVADDDVLLGARALIAVLTDPALSVEGRAAGVVIAGTFLPAGAVKSSIHVNGQIAWLDGRSASRLLIALQNAFNCNRDFRARQH